MKPYTRLSRASLFLAIIWTVFLAVSLFWNYLNTINTTLELANNELEISYKKVNAFRHWISSHGGVYVKVSDDLRPNPVLAGNLTRNITTLSNETLTLINTPYLLRDIENNYMGDYSGTARMVSAEPFHPLNQADDWEVQALKEINNGLAKVNQLVVADNGHKVMRMIRPIFMEAKCLSCHVNTSIKEGEVLGGLSISIPMKHYYDKQAISITNLLQSHFGLWLFGMAGIFLFYKSEARAHAAVEKQKMAMQKNQAKSEFLSAMSHELRTPLNAILGFSELLKTDTDNPLTSSQLESIDFIHQGGQHLLELVNQVLELSKIEAGKLDVVIEDVNIADIVAECLSFLEGQADKNGIHFEQKGIVDTVVRADRLLLKQILLNLCSNAIKYNKQGGSVILAFSSQGSNLLRITVADTGIGIPANKQSQIFTAFSRLGQETSNIEGTGIGLTITQRIVEAMNGHIGFESTEGQGSAFWFELAVAERH